MKEEYHIIGVMSGTSLDGIDLVEVIFTFAESWSFKILASETIAYPSEWKLRLGAAVDFSEVQLKALDKTYTTYLSEVIKTFISDHRITEIDAVCSHGHTIRHRPEQGITLQIGNLPEIAAQVGHKVVCDFRVQDVTLGGQGAPLVPVGDRLLFAKHNYCLNLGGFANCSYEQDGIRMAYDICPVNIVLNVFAEQLGMPYDDGGKIAATGIIDSLLLRHLNTVSFYEVSPPKSLGLEWVKEMIFPLLKASELAAEDILATFTEHIAMQIAVQFEEGSSVLVTGGGTYNKHLISRIKHYKKVEIAIPSEEIIEFKEALIFGLLGVLKLRDEINCLASVTGAEYDHSSGKIFFS